VTSKKAASKNPPARGQDAKSGKVQPKRVGLKTLAGLKVDPENPRKISKAALAGLQTSMGKFGDLSGIVFNRRTGELVAGHQRVDGLRKRHGDLPVHHEGEQAWIDVPGDLKANPPIRPHRFHIRIVDWDRETQRMANITANNQAIAGTFTDALQAQLDEIQEANDALFAELRLDELQDGPTPPDPEPGADDTPSRRAKAKARPGDVYLLGKHRLMCGDSTKAQDVDRLMAGERAACVFTDPPYGVEYESDAADAELRSIQNDDLKDGELIKKLLAPAMRQMARVAEDTAAFYIWHASSTREEFAYAMKAAGLVERQYLIWAKNSLVLGRADYQWAHEPCFYAAKDGASPAFYGDRTHQTVWTAVLSRDAGREMAIHIGNGVLLTDGQGGQIFVQARAPKGKKVRKLHVTMDQRLAMAHEGSTDTVWFVAKDSKLQHPNQKPVELSIRGIENSTQPGQVVLDLFGGSGSTLMGAEQTGRRAFLMEKDVLHVDQIIERWEKATGGKARKE
jgi:DNA modification methylase